MSFSDDEDAALEAELASMIVKEAAAREALEKQKLLLEIAKTKKEARDRAIEAERKRLEEEARVAKEKKRAEMREKIRLLQESCAQLTTDALVMEKEQLVLDGSSNIMSMAGNESSVEAVVHENMNSGGSEPPELSKATQTCHADAVNTDISAPPSITTPLFNSYFYQVTNVNKRNRSSSD